MNEPKIIKFMTLKIAYARDKICTCGTERFKNNPNLYFPKNYYFVINLHHYLFRCSHVKKIDLKEGK